MRHLDLSNHTHPKSQIEICRDTPNLSTYGSIIILLGDVSQKSLRLSPLGKRERVPSTCFIGIWEFMSIGRVRLPSQEWDRKKAW